MTCDIVYTSVASSHETKICSGGNHRGDEVVQRCRLKFLSKHHAVVAVAKLRAINYFSLHLLDDECCLLFCFRP